MSSILDALNKLEQDRAHAERSSEGVDVDPASAAQELIVPSVLRDRITLRFSPLTLILGGLAGALILVSFSAAAALLFVRPSEPEIAAVSDAAAQDTAVAAREMAPGTAVPLQEVTAADETVTIAAPSDEPLPEEAPSAAVPAKTEAPELSALEVTGDQPDAAAVVAASTEGSARELAPVPEMTLPLVEAAPPEETQMSRAEVAPPIKDVASALGAALGPGIVAPQERTPDARPSVPDVSTALKVEAVVPRAEPESPALSLKELPILTKAGQLQYADGPLMINMVGPASETNPQGYSVINKMTVYEGQTIPRTELRLLVVELDGVAVAVQGSGQRYYIKF